MHFSDIEILVAGPQHPALMEGLEQTFRVHRWWEIEDPAGFLRESGPRIRGVVTSFVYGADAALINALPNLEIIANYGVGVEKIALDVAQSRNIPVTNTPDISEPVADLAMALLLCAGRRICEAERFVRKGEWANGAFPFSTHIGGKACGIVGLGRIGRAVAKRAEAFGMTIAYYGPRPKSDVSYPYYDDLSALAQASDFLVLALPGGEETRQIVDAEILKALGSKGFLINVARGSVLDEAALYEALRSGVIAGAGLDVFEHEPVSDSPLFALENVVLLPHIASATHETRYEMGQVVLKNLKAHFSKEALPNPIH